MLHRSPHPGFSLLAWSTLAWNVLTILWGAVVRATGSGAGCGRHWPLCNGEVVPLDANVTTLIEFTHRLTSGVALLLVIWMFYQARRLFPAVSPVRGGALLSLLIILLEALLGAGLVLMRLVENNDSALRAVYMAAHLTNTLLLLAAIALTASWSSREWVQSFRERDSPGLLYLLAVSGFLLTGVTGAIAALGDTLFPTESLVEGLSMDFAPGTHFLLQIRIYHPPAAILAAFLLLVLARRAGAGGDRLRRLGRGLVFLVVVQLAAGTVNLALLAPVALQVVHLLLADLLWIVLVLYGDAITEGAFLRHRSGLL